MPKPKGFTAELFIQLFIGYFPLVGKLVWWSIVNLRFYPLKVFLCLLFVSLKSSLTSILSRLPLKCELKDKISCGQNEIKETSQDINNSFLRWDPGLWLRGRNGEKKRIYELTQGRTFMRPHDWFDSRFLVLFNKLSSRRSARSSASADQLPLLYRLQVIEA